MDYWQHSSQFCALFTSRSIIFSLTNDSALIFIYFFLCLCDIMAPSGMLSKADKLTSNIIALESTWHKCVFDQAFHISISQGTHSNEWMHIHAMHKHTFAHVFHIFHIFLISDSFAVHALIFIVRNILPVLGISFKLTC